MGAGYSFGLLGFASSNLTAEQKSTGEGAKLTEFLLASCVLYESSSTPATSLFTIVKNK